MNQFSGNQNGSIPLPGANRLYDMPIVPITDAIETNPFDEKYVGPGQFAAKDPYVGENDLESIETTFSDSTSIPSTDQSEPMTTSPTSPNNQPPVNVDKFNPVSFGAPESDWVENPTSESENVNLASNRVDEIPPARSLESILASIPGYQDDQSVEIDEPADLAEEDSIESPATANQSLADEVAEKLSRDPRFSFSQSHAVPIPIVTSAEAEVSSTVSVEVSMLDADEMNSPVAETEIATEDEAFPPVSWFAAETVPSSNNQTPVPFLDMSVPATIADPVSGEEVFDIKDFMDEVNASVPPIPGAFMDSTIVSLAVNDDASVNDFTLNRAIENLPEKLDAPDKFVEQLAHEPVPADDEPNQAQDELSETESALAACTEISSPISGGDPIFMATSSDELNGNDGQDNMFIAGEGDVIQIDGNDGYEFIDLACFQSETAKIEPGRILIVDESNSTFEIYYKNIQFALFAGEVRVDLPPMP